MEKIKIGIIGIGNCASALVQGLNYYQNKSEQDNSGIINWVIGGYAPFDIEIVAAFDIDLRKVGKNINEAIFMKPNCTKVFCRELTQNETVVQMGKVLDSYSEIMNQYPESERFIVAQQKQPSDSEISKYLKKTGCEILINYLPVGSEEATRFYAQCALNANVAFINCIPVFIANDEYFSKCFEEKNLPLIGDDIKAQLGATVTHRALSNLFNIRGVIIEKTYQLNTGGNTDFLNMLDRSRLKTKKITKTQAVQASIQEPLSEKNIHIGPSDYIPWLKD
ncbi:MAG: inositol-3-phosphate synthase, partial [Cyclobacteriaceae bacterium]